MVYAADYVQDFIVKEKISGEHDLRDLYEKFKVSVFVKKSKRENCSFRSFSQCCHIAVLKSKSGYFVACGCNVYQDKLVKVVFYKV